MKFAQQFPDLDTVWKIELVENGKSLEFLFCFVLFFESYNKCLINEFVFVLVKSYSISPVFLQRIMKEALFLRF